MKYQTLIKIFTEAENEHEAVDIAGEFLRGNFETGVKMECCTKPIKLPILFRTSALLLLTSAFIGIASFGYFKSAPLSLSRMEHVSAFQPPLKTSHAAEFKEIWQEEKDKKVLDYIKD